jgi:hypothetical protein
MGRIHTEPVWRVALCGRERTPRVHLIRHSHACGNPRVVEDLVLCAEVGLQSRRSCSPRPGIPFQDTLMMWSRKDVSSLGRRCLWVMPIVCGDGGRRRGNYYVRFLSHSSFRTAYRYSSDHPPLNQTFSRKCPSRRIPTRSSSAREGLFLQSAMAATRWSPRSSKA